MKIIHRKRFVYAILIILGTFASISAQSSSITDPELIRLRHEWAMRYLEPGPHMALAKYFRNKGNSLQAFYILENARRYRFEQKVFDDAFLLHFGGFAPLDNSKAEEEKYINLRKTSPDDVKIITHLADIYISRADYVRGEPLLRLAFEKDPQNYSTLVALEELYRRLDTPEKGIKLVKDFEEKYPNSKSVYILRLSRILNGDPKAAKQLLIEAIGKYSDEGYFWFARGVLAMRAKDLEEAEASFVKATILDVNSIRYHAAAASFFRVERNDPKRAIEYYLKVYFLDPHAHFDGFAEAKISNLNYDISKAFVEASILNGKKPTDLLEDPNPAVVGIALSKIVNNWESSKTELFIRMMRHDDILVRWSAMQTLTAKEGRKLDFVVKDLLKDSDLRVRGLAAYMAVGLWKHESFPEMRKVLAEEAQVLRFDAISALLMKGGPEGRKIALEHRTKEPNESLRKLIETSAAADK